MSGSGDAALVVSTRIFTIPNMISMLRLALVPLFGYLILHGHDVGAVITLFVAGATDWLDGTLARALGQVTELGKKLDPVADRLYIFVALVGLTLRGIIPWWLVALVVLRELVLMGSILALRRHGFDSFEVHLAGKAATFSLMYAFPFLLLGSLGGAVGYGFKVAGWAGALWGVVLYWVAGVIYLAQVLHALHDDDGATPPPSGGAVS